MKSFDWDRFNSVPIIGILRGFDPALLPGITGACIAGGLTSIEVTMNSPGAAGQIREVAKLSVGQLNIGAGTVLNLDLLEEALAAGASFIVTPGLHIDVIKACVARGVPVFPGVLSPTEISRALDLGATWVKVFPGDRLGTSYIAAIKTSFANLKLLPTGGANLETLPELIRAGADGFGIGRPLFDPERLQAREWPWLEDRCRAFVQCYEKPGASVKHGHADE